MKKSESKATPSVEERVHSAIAVLRSNDPGRRISIVELCRAAGVNRANLYTNHQKLLSQLKDYSPQIASTQPESRRQAEKHLSELISRQVKVIASLRYSCLELYMELHRVRQQVVEMERSNGYKGYKKR